MLRHRLRLLAARLAIAAGAAAMVGMALAPSWGQDLSTEQRLDRLERDLNMLQRQIYQGGPPPVIGGDAEVPGGTGGAGAVDIEVRMERLEQQMRDLTGRIEEVGNRVEQLRQRIERVNSDVAMRFGDTPAPSPGAQPAVTMPNGPLPEGGPPVAAPPDLGASVPPPPPYAPAPASEPGGDLTPPPSSASSGPTPIFGTLTPPGAVPAAPPPPPPRELASTAPAAAAAGGKAPVAAAGGTGPGGSPAAQFEYAFDLVKKADYPGAEIALKAFVDQHPRDRLAGSAQYWLGETYYTRGRYIEAASAFAEGYKRYPKSPKASDDLLKLGMSLARADQKQNACLALLQLDRDFPHPTAAVKERAAAERKRLGC